MYYARVDMIFSEFLSYHISINFDIFGRSLPILTCPTVTGCPKCRFAALVVPYSPGNLEYHARRVGTQFLSNFRERQKGRQSSVFSKTKKPFSSIGTQEFYRRALMLLFSFFITMISQHKDWKNCAPISLQRFKNHLLPFLHHDPHLLRLLSPHSLSYEPVYLEQPCANFRISIFGRLTEW